MSQLLTPDAPLLIPFCGRCDQPVYRLKFDRYQGPHAWAFQAQCCGATRGMRVSAKEILRVQTTGEKVYAIPSRGHAQTIKHQARLETPKAKALRVWMPR